MGDMEAKRTFFHDLRHTRYSFTLEPEWLYLIGGGALLLTTFGIAGLYFMTEVAKGTLLVLMVGIGALNRIPARISKLRGFEIWLPFTIITAFALGPVAGTLVGCLALIISQAIMPDYLPGFLVALPITAGVAYFASTLNVSVANLAVMGILASGVYNLVSNPIYFAMGQSAFRIVKFAIFSMWIDWIVYKELGPWLFKILAG